MHGLGLGGTVLDRGYRAQAVLYQRAAQWRSAAEAACRSRGLRWRRPAAAAVHVPLRLFSCLMVEQELPAMALGGWKGSASTTCMRPHDRHMSGHLRGESPAP